MPNSNASETQNAGTSPETNELATSLLSNGPTQVGGMVTSVILVGQAFARFNETAALFVALLFSCLLAVYQVKLVQKACAKDCYILVPIASLIIFALALGGNNSLKPAYDNTASNQELEGVKKELALKTAELENTKQLLNQLKTAMNLPVTTLPSSENTSQSDSYLWQNQVERMAALFDFLIAGVHAQAPEPIPQEEVEKQRMLLEALRNYEIRQQQIQKEQQQLEEEQRKRREEAEKYQQPAPIWQKW